MKVIAVTGVPGTGKTMLSKKLTEKLGFYYLDVNKLISKRNLSEGYDKKRKTKIVDIGKFNALLINKINVIKKFGKNQLTKNNLDLIFFKIENNLKKFNGISVSPKARSAMALNNNKSKSIKGIIIDSHLSHYLPKKYIDLCVVAKCNIKKLGKRLKKKRFHKEKIKENIQAAIFDVCFNEALERKHNVLVVDTTKGFNIQSIAKHLGG